MNQSERIAFLTGLAWDRTEQRLFSEMIGLRADKDKDEQRLQLFAQLDALPLLINRFKAELEKGEG